MSITLAEARHRAATIADVAYDLHLDLTRPERGRFGIACTISFTATAAETFLELTDATELVVRVDGVEVDPGYDGRRLHLSGLGASGGTRHEVLVTGRAPYVSDGDGMHLVTDPADGATYASAYVGMDVAQRVLPCFDQNNLKARVRLAVTAEAGWTVLANGRLEDRQDGADGTLWRFAVTQPIPVAMFVVCAGPWHSVTWEHAGRTFGWHARASLAAELDRDADELRRVTEACFDHYAVRFSEPYAFGDYHQAFVPGQNWGALETPGCVTYRDELLPRGRVTGALRTRRASIIAHEMAHMWFGNLVTMTWWEDTWLQESFADYMGITVAGEAVGDPAALLSFEISGKPRAHDADLRRSTHPVAPEAEDVPDVDAAANNFDAISYSKGNACLRQLVTWLGEDAFRAGLDAYLSRHRGGNAVLGDFLDALDSASPSDRDVRGWAQLWLREPGHDTLRVTRDDDGTPVLVRLGARPHRLRVDALRPSSDGALRLVEQRWLDVADEPVRLDGWAGLVVLPNAGGETFAALAPDEFSWRGLADGLSSLDPVARAVVWTHVLGAVRARLLDADAFLALVARHLPAEREAVVVASVVTRTLDYVLPERVPSSRAGAALEVVAQACREGLQRADGDLDARTELVRGLAATSRDVAELRAWLDGGRAGAAGGEQDVELDPSLRWTTLRRLAEIGALDAEEVERERVADGTVQGELGAARALASRPTAEAKAEAWSRLADDDAVSNRMLGALASGLWSVEQAALLAPYVAAYLETAPRLARRGQAFAQEVHRAFPALALTAHQVGALRSALESPDLPAVLRRGWEDRLDDLA